MSSFEDRKKNFENKFAHDEELKFKVNSKRNKYLGEWAAEILGKKDQEKEQYILEVIKSDFSEPGDEDIIKKLYQDLKNKNKKPILVYCDTIKGKGVSFMENNNKFHSVKDLSEENYRKAISELS